MRRCVGVVAVMELFGCPSPESLKRKGAPVVTSELTVAELERSEHIIFKAVQRESFAGDIAALRNRKSLVGTSRLFKLSPMIADDGLLRVSGRTELVVILGADAKRLTTDATINAIRRFVARRGPVNRLISDNSTNFRGADNELRKSLKELENSVMKDRLTSMGIDWRFNPPGGPHMGGCYERLVRSVKVALGVALKERYPEEDLLHTLLLEAEFLVNSRPLTHVSVDPDDPESISPNHFLIAIDAKICTVFRENFHVLELRVPDSLGSGHLVVFLTTMA
ncbi:unnamed protein product [Allacma fusca]|uniref:Integrase catalytic domain-containing protein n=1 Tax=Allacma fusca TaxID=39272 RepID=A0A8J2KR71_9HEXA|nr:unnamed protein product [Allacma fusca]